MKKIVVAVTIALLASPAWAQAPDAANRELIESWVATVINNRIKKNWTPKLYAGQVTAIQMGTVAGLPVTVDPAMKERALELRNVEPFDDIHQFTRQPITIPANEVLAERRW